MLPYFHLGVIDLLSQNKTPLSLTNIHC